MKTTKRSDRNVQALEQEVKELRETVEALLDALDSDNGVKINRSDCDKLGAKHERTIDPPWERNGYDSKQAWQEAKRAN